MSNDKLLNTAKKVMPGGVSSPVRAFNNVKSSPFAVVRADGDKLYDANGRAYIDFVCSFGPDILGHNNKEVANAVHSAVDKGLTFAATCESEIALAQMIVDAVESADMVRFVNSGTEATMSAIRLARGYTNKKYIIKFNGCYHGHSDNLLVKSGSGLLTNSLPNSSGVLSDFTKYTLVAQYNDIQSVKSLFEEYRDDIACVIVEPVAANMGVVLTENNFLQSLRDITKENGSLLIFDEVITGFRLLYGCAQSYYNVLPDITTLGKIIGGGLPIGAYCASSEIMENVSPLGNVYQAGTLSGNPIATAAGLKTLQILQNSIGIYDSIEAKAKRISTAFNTAFKGRAHANQIGSLLTFFFTDKAVKNFDDVLNCNTDAFADFFDYMLDKGFYIPPSQFEALFISNAHSDEDIDSFIKAFEEYASQM